jgi:integrative and conjugative element protein (TIGR02256 family)
MSNQELSIDPTSWIAIYPDHYRTEQQYIRRAYRDFVISTTELDGGRLVMAGTLTIDIGKAQQHQNVVIQYPAETPFKAPTITPVQSLPSGARWTSGEVLDESNVKRMPPGYRRHQMASGSLCLFETEAYRHIETIGAREVLRRAKSVFTAVALRKEFPFPDSEQADLEAYTHAVGDIVVGERLLATDATSGVLRAIIHPEDLSSRQEKHPRLLLIALDAAGISDPMSSIELGWEDEHDSPLANVYPWLRALSSDFITSNEKANESLVRGRWITIDEEPPPLAKGSDLEPILMQAGVADPGAYLELLARGSALPLLGLRFPGRDGAMDWLFLTVTEFERPTKEDEQRDGAEVMREGMRAARVVILRLQPIVPKTLRLRNRGRVQETLENVSILVIGLGAVGSDVAECLVKAGVGHLILVDHDVMHAGNVVRHNIDLRGIGASKVDAVRRRLLAINPFASVDSIAESGTSDLSLLTRRLRSCDLAISTIADESVEMVINEAAVRVGTAAIYGRALRGGTVARVFRVRPRLDACKYCLAVIRTRGLGSSSNVGQDDIEWIDIPEAKHEVITYECGNPVLAGSAVDLRFVAALTTRCALDYLEGIDTPNVLLWTQEDLTTLHPNLNRLSTFQQVIAPLVDCIVCGARRAVRIRLSADAEATIRRLAGAKFDRETGGILIGRTDRDGSIDVLMATDAGPAAVETRTLFERDIDFVRQELALAAERLGHDIDYVGEWHSHVDASLRPSARDIESMTGIASSHNYLTREPIMIIARVDSKARKVTALEATCFPMGHPHFAIALLPGSNDKEIDG